MSLAFSDSMTPLRQWPATERPRERLLDQGPQSMSEAELLALVLGTTSRGGGGVLGTSRELLARFAGLKGLKSCQAAELMQVPGIGQAKACAIVAVIELARRLESTSPKRGDPITCAEDVYQRFKAILSHQRQELFFVLALDARHRILAVHQVGMGSATSVEVHPREVFGPLVRDGAAAGIVLHNHPSGDPEPSALDEQLTRRLKQVAELLGIDLLDHIVVGEGGFASMAHRGCV